MALIEAIDIVKVYPNGVLANDRVSLAVEPGEIHALVGENGAGKSTLMKVLYGLEHPTAGEIRLRGAPVTIHSPQDAIDLGIGMVHQNFMLVNSFTIAQNIALGRETTTARGLGVDFAQAIEDTEALSKEYGLYVDPTARVDTVPVGMRQRVEILKALYRGAEILILDEPTAVLTPRETNDLFDAIRNLVRGGKTVIFITHKLREVMEISDRVTVMRDARTVGTVHTPDTSEAELARMMVGREVFMVVDRPPVQRGKAVLEVEDLTYINEHGRTLLDSASFKVYESEILGIAGVEGNGQTELVEVLTGLLHATGGEARIDGVQVLGAGPRRVREARCAHIPEDRLTNGVDQTIRYPRPERRAAGRVAVRRQYAEGRRRARAIIVAAPADRRPTDARRRHRRDRVHPPAARRSAHQWAGDPARVGGPAGSHEAVGSHHGHV